MSMRNCSSSVLSLITSDKIASDNIEHRLNMRERKIIHRLDISDGVDLQSSLNCLSDLKGPQKEFWIYPYLQIDQSF